MPLKRPTPPRIELPSNHGTKEFRFESKSVFTNLQIREMCINVCESFAKSYMTAAENLPEDDKLRMLDRADVCRILSKAIKKKVLNTSVLG